MAKYKAVFNVGATSTPRHLCACRDAEIPSTFSL